jgi:hypothetical protein
VFHGHDGDSLSELLQQRQVLRLVQLAQPSVVIIVLELSEAAPAGVDVRQCLKDLPEGEGAWSFPRRVSAVCPAR